jgi:hypothetical protein
MKFEIKTDNFKIKHYNNLHPDKLNEIVLTESFEDVTKALIFVLNSWNDEQCQNLAEMVSTKESALRLKAMAETLINCADVALENDY